MSKIINILIASIFLSFHSVYSYPSCSFDSLRVPINTRITKNREGQILKIFRNAQKSSMSGSLTKEGRLINPEAIDWLIKRIETIHKIRLTKRLKIRIRELFSNEYINKTSVNIDRYSNELNEEEKQQFRLIVREAGFFHNGTFGGEDFSADVQIDAGAARKMSNARKQFLKRMEFFKGLSDDYWKKELPQCKGIVSMYNEHLSVGVPKTSVAILSLFGRRYEALLRRLDELNSIKNKNEIELVIVIADPENISKDKWNGLEHKIKSVEFPVKVVRTKKNTISTNRNLSFSLSSGKYQVYVDDDVKLVGSVIEKLVNALDLYPELGMVSVPTYDQKSELFKPRFQLKYFVNDNLLVTNLVLGMITAARRDIIQVNPFLPFLGNLGDDIHFVRQMHALGFLGGYVLDTDAYTIDEQIEEGSATRGQINIMPYLIEEGLVYYLNSMDYSEYEYKRAGYIIRVFSKKSINHIDGLKFWKQFSASLIEFLQSDKQTFEFNSSAYAFAPEINDQIRQVIEYYQNEKERIVEYKRDKYDPKNLAHVNTFFGILKYSIEPVLPQLQGQRRIKDQI